MLGSSLHKGTERKCFRPLDQRDEAGRFGDVEFGVEDGNCIDFLVCLLAVLVINNYSPAVLLVYTPSYPVIARTVLHHTN